MHYYFCVSEFKFPLYDIEMKLLANAGVMTAICSMQIFVK